MPSAQPLSTHAQFPRRAIFGLESFSALPLSIALHLVVLYVISQTSWPVTKARRDSERNVVWFQEWRSPEEEHAKLPPEESLEELEKRPPDKPSVAEMEIVPEDPEDPEDSPAVDSTAESPPVDSGLEPALADSPRSRPRPAEEGPGPEAENGESLPHALDWEDAARDVIARMREEREREESFLTFSRDDLMVKRPSAGPAPATLTVKPWPPCPVINRPAIQLMMVMVGMCFRTRDAGSDLAALRADGSEWRPECAPIMDSDGNETYKCRLVPR